jgi:hypothetical protein
MNRQYPLGFEFPPFKGPHHGTRELAWGRFPTTTLLILLPALCAMGSGCCQNDIHRIPAIRGRVVEAKTNKPIAGARLVRWFEREDGCLAPGGSDVHRVAGSLLSVTSGEDGSFEWPAWAGLMKPILSMKWYVYHLGWVAEDGWLTHPRPRLEGYFFGVDGAQPWVHLTFRPVGSHLEVTIGMEPTDSTAAWEAHFQRLEVLTRYGELDVEEFVKEAAKFAEGHELTPNIRNEFAKVRGSLGYALDNGHYFKPDQALQLLTIEEQYCARHQQERGCDVTVLFRDRAWLEEKISANRK